MDRYLQSGQRNPSRKEERRATTGLDRTQTKVTSEVSELLTGEGLTEQEPSNDEMCTRSKAPFRFCFVPCMEGRVPTSKECAEFRQRHCKSDTAEHCPGWAIGLEMPHLVQDSRVSRNVVSAIFRREVFISELSSISETPGSNKYFSSHQSQQGPDWNFLPGVSL